MKQLFCLAALSAALLFTSGCGGMHDSGHKRGVAYLGGGQGHHDEGRPPFDNVSYWDGDGVQGSPSIRISLAEQRAYFYKGGELVGISLISTGREGLATPSGSFRIQQKDAGHKSSLYGDWVDASGNVLKKDIEMGKDPRPPGGIFDGAKMPNFMRITGGVGMHAGFLPGHPASDGCIRMPAFMAKNFFDNVSVGTPVSVTN